MKIILTSDHAGFEMKNVLYHFLKDKGYDIVDHGPFELDPEDDYPDFVAPVAEEVSENYGEVVGIVIGGSGQGEAIMANRFSNVRAVVFNGQYQQIGGQKNPDEIILSRQHNDSNILALGARFLNTDDAKEAVEKWITTPFGNEPRHKRRIEKIENLAPRRGKELND